MNLNDYKGILVFAEQRDGIIAKRRVRIIRKSNRVSI